MTEGSRKIRGYEMLDFGHGRKLEQFGELILDRPSPAAEGQPKESPDKWHLSDIVLDAKGNLKTQTQRAGDFLNGKAPWVVTWGAVLLQLRVTPFGHIGVFPEQVTNWTLLKELTQRYAATGTTPRCLNLFAYTGGSTLAMAYAGASVVHVDASGPAVNWARRNSEASELSELPIRWIQEDARKFVTRECKRQNTYQLVVLDPPSFGHGPKGRRWDITQDLAPLLGDVASLMSAETSHIILSGHSTIPSAHDIEQMLCEGLRRAGRKTVPQASTIERLKLITSSGRALDAGYSIHVEVAPM